LTPERCVADVTREWDEGPPGVSRLSEAVLGLTTTVEIEGAAKVSILSMERVEVDSKREIEVEESYGCGVASIA